ncbi:MAG: hypothetical protein ABEJ69_03270 [Candidatus Nanohaloarchaea archaeon]
MDIVEEITRRRLTLEKEDPETAYSELRELLEDRMKFSAVHEEKYYNDVDGRNLRAKILTVFGMDKYTEEQYEIYFHVDRETSEVDIQVQAKLVTSYPDEKGYQKTLWYYAYRSLFDKFLYGEVRHGYVHAVEERVDELIDKMRMALEDDYNG